MAPSRTSAHRRVWLLIATTALSAMVLTTHPAGAATPPITLAGTTTITAISAASSAQIDVARDIAFSGTCYPENNVTVTGTAAAVLVTLIYNNNPGTPAEHFGRFQPQEGGHTFSTMCGGGAALKAGRYTLVMQHTPGTATLTLRLPGLGGQRSFTPTATRSRTSIALLSPVSPYDRNASIASFGATDTLTAKGMVLVFGWATTGLSAVSSVGDCEVDGPVAASAPAILTQAPGCPVGGSGFDIPGPRGAGTSFHGGGIGNVDPGLRTVSLYYISQAPASSAGGFAVWIPTKS